MAKRRSIVGVASMGKRVKGTASNNRLTTIVYYWYNYTLVAASIEIYRYI